MYRTHRPSSSPLSNTTIVQGLRASLLLLPLLLLLAAATPALATDAPASCLATPGNAQVEVNWDEVTGATYSVLRSETAGGRLLSGRPSMPAAGPA